MDAHPLQLLRGTLSGTQTPTANCLTPHPNHLAPPKQLPPTCMRPAVSSIAGSRRATDAYAAASAARASRPCHQARGGGGRAAAPNTK